MLVINSQSLISKIDEISNLIYTSKPLAVCLSETRLTSDIGDNEIFIKGYSIVRCDSENRHTGGVLMYIKENVILLETVKYTYLKNFWLLSVKISVNNKHYVLVCIYHSPSSSDADFLRDFEEWCQGIQDITCPRIIVGDFNIDWTVNNTYKNRLKNLMGDIGIQQWVGSITRPNDSGGSIIDLVFSDIINLKCKVHQTPKITDHYIVCINPNTEKTDKQDKHLISRGKINFPELNQKLSLINWNYTHSNIDDKYNYFISVIKSKLEEVAPKKEVVIRARFQEWWNDKIREAIEQRDLSYKIYKRNKTQSNREIYKHKRNLAQKIIREEKKIYYENKIDHCKHEPKKMWDALKPLIAGRKGYNLKKIKIDDEEVSDPTEMSNKLNSFYINSINNIISDIDTTNQIDFIDEIRTPDNTLSTFKLIDYKELQKVVFSLPNKGSPDEITAEFLKNIYYSVEKPLLNLVNTSLETGKLPSHLKISTVIPVPKVNNVKEANDLRPINMLVTIEKLIERIVYEQVSSYIIENNILFSNQSGFRKGHSCETAVQNILYDWKEQQDKGVMIGAVFLDLKRAFETIEREKLIKKLKGYGITGIPLSWLVDYLQNRKQITKINGEVSDEILNKNGVPQGSTLGPLLFLIYINDIVKSIEKCQIHLFADDTLLYFSSKDLTTLVDTINNELRNIVRWCNGNLLKLNASKSKFMLISNNQKYDEFKRSFEITVECDKIENIEKIKYLGILIDKNLTFKEHASYVINKISKNTNFLSRVAPFLTQWSKITIYNTLILPHLTFAASILYSANKNEIERMQKLQNRAMRIILRVPRDTSIKTMLRNLDWLSVQYYLEYQTLTLIHKMKLSLTPTYLTSKIVFNADIHNYNTRTRTDIRVTTKNKKLTEKSLFHKGIIRYNNLDNSLKNCVAINTFKTKLRSSLLSECIQ